MKKEVFLTLSKLARQNLREKRVELLLTRAKEEALRNAMAKAEAQLQKERDFVRKNPKLQHLFESYQKAVSQQQARLRIEKNPLDSQLHALQHTIGQLFQQAKSYEIPYSRYQKLFQQMAQKSEQKTLDETALEIFRQREKYPRNSKESEGG